MVELEESSRFTAMTGRTDEGALAPIPVPDGTADPRRDVANSGARARPGGKLCAGAPRGPGSDWFPASTSPQLPFLELNDQGVERAVEHLSDIPRGNRMAEQGLGIAELL